MKHCILIASLLTLLFACRIHAGDDRLTKLEDALDSAVTTAEMNGASWELATYLDERLRELETQLRVELIGESLKQFDKASMLWRDYRSTYADAVYQHYKDGTIRGLMSNSARIRLTQERIALLQDLAPE